MLHFTADRQQRQVSEGTQLEECCCLRYSRVRNCAGHPYPRVVVTDELMKDTQCVM